MYLIYLINLYIIKFALVLLATMDPINYSNSTNQMCSLANICNTPNKKFKEKFLELSTG